MKRTTVNTPAPVWFDRADIPNSIGFRFLGYMRDGSEEVCNVIRREDGSHTLANDAFPRLLKWRRIAPGTVTPAPYLQASFSYREEGGEVQSFALIRQGEGESAVAVAICDTRGKTVMRYLCADSLALTYGPAFRAAVCAILDAGPVAPFAAGTYGPAFTVPEVGPIVFAPLFRPAAESQEVEPCPHALAVEREHRAIYAEPAA